MPIQSNPNPVHFCNFWKIKSLFLIHNYIKSGTHLSWKINLLTTFWYLLTSLPSTCFINFLSLSRVFQCSFYPQCNKSPAKIEEAVHSYERRYGVVGLPFNCYHSPRQPHLAIRSRRFHVYHVVNGVLWSSLFLIMITVVLLFTVRKRGCDFCELWEGEGEVKGRGRRGNERVGDG